MSLSGLEVISLVKSIIHRDDVDVGVSSNSLTIVYKKPVKDIKEAYSHLKGVMECIYDGMFLGDCLVLDSKIWVSREPYAKRATALFGARLVKNGTGNIKILNTKLASEIRSKVVELVELYGICSSEDAVVIKDDGDSAGFFSYPMRENYIAYYYDKDSIVCNEYVKSVGKRKEQQLLTCFRSILLSIGKIGIDVDRVELNIPLKGTTKTIYCENRVAYLELNKTVGVNLVL